VTGLLVNDYSQRNPPSLGEAMTGLLGNWGGNIEQGLLSALPFLAENDPYKIGQQLLRDGVGVGGIAWHGSPHKFTRPDLSKIGTGEGAQAYGHGFYSAEARGVGEEYRKNLQRMGNPSVKDRDGSFGAMLTEHFPAGTEGRQYHQQVDVNGIVFQGPDAVVDGIKHGMIKKGDVPDEVFNAAQTFLDPGHLYKMNIPDETIDKMLDWDKPLSEQSDYARGKLTGLLGTDDHTADFIDYMRREFPSFVEDGKVVALSPTQKTNFISAFREDTGFGGAVNVGNAGGADIYSTISRDGISPKKLTQRFNNRDEAVEFFKAEKQRFKDAPMSSGKGTYEPVAKLDGDEFTVETYDQFGKTYGQQAASEYLNSLGIPGIKYLDGMSRAAGQGSRNFVSFTPDHIEMLERNGIPMKGLLD
jgi:hypothetical protein